jgi:hypothetical protein
MCCIQFFISFFLCLSREREKKPVHNRLRLNRVNNAFFSLCRRRQWHRLHKYLNTGNDDHLVNVLGHHHGCVDEQNIESTASENRQQRTECSVRCVRRDAPVQNSQIDPLFQSLRKNHAVEEIRGETKEYLADSCCRLNWTRAFATSLTRTDTSSSSVSLKASIER